MEVVEFEMKMVFGCVMILWFYGKVIRLILLKVLLIVENKVFKNKVFLVFVSNKKVFLFDFVKFFCSFIVIFVVLFLIVILFGIYILCLVFLRYVLKFVIRVFLGENIMWMYVYFNDLSNLIVVWMNLELFGLLNDIFKEDIVNCCFEENGLGVKSLLLFMSLIFVVIFLFFVGFFWYELKVKLFSLICFNMFGNCFVNFEILYLKIFVKIIFLVF